ncbi:MAG: hypothetical protein V3V96_13135 [Acidiferrobacterales bacterium]
MEFSRRLDCMCKISVVVLIALATLGVTAGPARADHSWSRLRLADFPAYVKAIEFADGTWDASNPSCWGKWCVDFASERLEAKWMRTSPPPPPGNMDFRVIGLQCENPVVGRVPCWIWMSVVYGEHQCTVVIEEGDSPDIRIGCPRHVVFE